MVDLFDEVEEELRNERYKALLRQWGPWVGGAAAAIVLGTGSYQFVSWSGGRVANAASDRYQDAAELFDEGDMTEADARFASLAEDGPSGYAALALMRRGDIALENGDRSEAAQFYAQAAERSPEPLTADIARYQAALAQFDELSYDDLVLRLEPLAAGAAPMGLMARELMAAAALRDERWEEAEQRYDALALSLDLPPGLSQRITEAIAYIDQRSAAPPVAAITVEGAATEDVVTEEAATEDAVTGEDGR